MEKTVAGRKRHGISKANGVRSSAQQQRVRLCAFCLRSEAQNARTNEPESLVECSECKSCGTYVHADESYRPSFVYGMG